jgi:Spy/CpxP family protein refolding chaperone
MKKSIAPVLALGAVVALLLTTAAMAQPGRMMHGPGRFMDPDRLAEYLSLNETQKIQVQKLQEKTKQAMEPLFQEHRQLAEAVRTALESNADATTVGNAVIAAWEHGQKIRTVHEQFEAELEKLLTPAQLSRWQSLKEARKMMHPPIPGLGPDVSDSPDGD